MALYCSICSSIHEYNRLTNEMIEEIKFLRAEVVRWRRVLIKYLDPGWADGLRQDIFDNIFQNFEDYDAYQWYVNNCCNGMDPLDNEEQSAFLARLKDGTDETSIDYI
ncbi:MAG: potassium channel protein [Lachnospiraceae bacterium]|nr:potassium channel protein [Lachnospiraceae bacterium]